jgi:hypothetical protein
MLAHSDAGGAAACRCPAWHHRQPFMQNPGSSSDMLDAKPGGSFFVCTASTQVQAKFCESAFHLHLQA